VDDLDDAFSRMAFDALPKTIITDELRAYIDACSGEEATPGGDDGMQVKNAPKTPAELAQMWFEKERQRRGGKPPTHEERQRYLTVCHYLLHSPKLRSFLSDSERSVLKWGDEHKNEADGSVMIVGKVSKEKGYGPYSCHLMQQSTYASQYLNINKSNLDLFCHNRSLSPNKWERTTARKICMINLGQGQAGKTYTTEAAVCMGIPGTYELLTSDGSRQAFSNGGEHLNFKTLIYDEAPTYMVLSEKKLHGEQLSKLNEMKAILTHGKNVRIVTELRKDPLTNKSTRFPVTLVTSLRLQIITNTNFMYNKDEAFGSRFFTRTVAKDRGMETVRNAASSAEKQAIIKRVAPHMVHLEQSIEYVSYILHFCIGVGALEPPTGTLSNMFLVEILTNMFERGVKNAPDARNFVRIYRQAVELCLQRNIVKYYFMEEYNGLGYKKNFDFFRDLPVLELLLFHTIEDVCISLAFLSEHYFDALEYPIVRHLLKENLGIGPEDTQILRAEYSMLVNQIRQQT
jgi:hypothetical protein